MGYKNIHVILRIFTINKRALDVVIKINDNNLYNKREIDYL